MKVRTHRGRWRPTSKALRLLINREFRAQTIAGQALAASSLEVFLEKVEAWKKLTGRMWQRLPRSKAVKAAILKQTAREKKA